jgi:hypothetical protein
MTFSTRMFLMSCAAVLFGTELMTAQSAEVFGGYFVANMKPENTSFNRTTMNGWNTSITGYPTSRLGFTADFTGSYANTQPLANASSGSGADISIHQYSYMAGPQFRVIRRDRFETSFKALFGAARGYIPDGSLPAGSAIYGQLDQTVFAAQFGSNFDVKMSKKVALRFSPGLYLTQFGNDETQKNFRFSVGPVFRFGGGER